MAGWDDCAAVPDVGKVALRMHADIFDALAGLAFLFALAAGRTAAGRYQEPTLLALLQDAARW